MAIEGALQDVALADICQLLAMGRKTGCLSLTDRSNFGYVYFEDGRVIYSSVLNRPDRLGELLVRNNVIARSDLSAAMEAQADHDLVPRLREHLRRRLPAHMLPSDLVLLSTLSSASPRWRGWREC